MARPEMKPLTVDTAALLDTCQRAMQKAGKDADFALFDSAESVMSALTVVLKYPRAELPAELRPHIDKIGGKYVA